MVSIGFNDNTAELLNLYDQSSNSSGVGYIDNYDDLKVTDLLNSGNTLKKPIIVEKLPTNGIESQIYLIKDPENTDEQNRYIEYIWVDGKFEILGGNGNGNSGGGTGENIQRIDYETIDKLFD